MRLKDESYFPSLINIPEGKINSLPLPHLLLPSGNEACRKTGKLGGHLRERHPHPGICFVSLAGYESKSFNTTDKTEIA